MMWENSIAVQSIFQKKRCYHINQLNPAITIATNKNNKNNNNNNNNHHHPPHHHHALLWLIEFYALSLTQISQATETCESVTLHIYYYSNMLHKYIH